MANEMYPFRRPVDPQPSAPRSAAQGSIRTASVAESAEGSSAIPTPDDPRQAALQMLLDKAALYGDGGASTATVTNILNGVDMGRADRTTALYGTRQQQLQDSGKTYLDALSAALTKKRQNANRVRTVVMPAAPPLPPFQWTPFNWRQFFDLTPPAGPGARPGARGGSIRGTVDI